MRQAVLTAGMWARHPVKIWLRHDNPSSGSRPQQRSWKEVRQLFFHLTRSLEQNSNGEWKKKGVKSAELKPQGTRARSRCSPIVILHAIWTILVRLEKTPPVPAAPLKMDEQQDARWNACKEEQKETGNYTYTFFSFKTKAKSFLSACKTTWTESLINPMCSCLWGVKSERSCPMWPQGSAGLCRVEDPGDLTALSHKIPCCVYSLAWNSKYEAHTFQLYTRWWSL